MALRTPTEKKEFKVTYVISWRVGKNKTIKKGEYFVTANRDAIDSDIYRSEHARLSKRIPKDAIDQNIGIRLTIVNGR